MSFHVRLLDGPRYQTLVRELEQARAGDGDVLKALVDDALARLEDRAFRRWNASAGWLAGLWKETLQQAMKEGLRDETSTREVSRVLVPLLCMPDYQHSGLAAEEPSPAFVELGDDDGGLLVALRNLDAWFDQLFLDKFATAPAPYAEGDAMIRLDATELQRLRDLLQDASLASTGDPLRRSVLDRLRQLVSRARNSRALEVAVSTREA